METAQQSAKTKQDKKYQNAGKGNEAKINPERKSGSLHVYISHEMIIIQQKE